MSEIDNKGNLVTQRSFVIRNGKKVKRIDLLAEVLHVAGSTAYQMTEEVGPYGSGTPSPLYKLCELIKRLDEVEREEGDEVSGATELAQYPMIFLSQLRGDIASEGDAVAKLNFLLKSASDAVYDMKGRDLKDLNFGELKDFAQKMLTACTMASELGLMIDARIETKNDSYPGAPVQRERTLRATEQG
jgi:uncharacterized protein Yka (UPF0111/DUF47 family)